MALDIKPISISLDFYNRNIVCVNAKQLDSKSRYIDVTFTDRGKKIVLDPTTVSAIIRYKKSDGYYCLNNATQITESGTALFELTQQMLSVSGKNIADIMIVDATGLEVENISDIQDFYDLGVSIISTMSFYINTEAIAINNSVIESSYEYDALTTAIATSASIEAHMKELEQEILEAEEQRVAADIEREEKLNQKVGFPLDEQEDIVLGQPGQILIVDHVGNSSWIDSPNTKNRKAQLATAMAMFNGEMIDLEKCLYTFTKTEGEKHYVISNQTADGNDVYLSCCEVSNTIIANSVNSAIIELTRYEDPVFSLWSHATNNAGYLQFHQTESSDGKYLIYDRNNVLVNGVYFEIYMKSESELADSPIAGYTKITALDEIKDGGRYLIASQADDGNYYVVYPTLETTPYSHVARVLTEQQIEKMTFSDSMYKYAVEAGYTGTEEEFAHGLASIDTITEELQLEGTIQTFGYDDVEATSNWGIADFDSINIGDTIDKSSIFENNGDAGQFVDSKEVVSGMVLDLTYQTFFGAYHTGLIVTNTSNVVIDKLDGSTLLERKVYVFDQAGYMFLSLCPRDSRKTYYSLGDATLKQTVVDVKNRVADLEATSKDVTNRVTELETVNKSVRQTVTNLENRVTNLESVKPLVLYAEKAEEYTTDATSGDEALNAILTGRQILVRVPNADGGQYTAIYSPVLMYQLPNYANNYLYLLFLNDGLDANGMPSYNQLKMLLSKTYNETPLVS